VGQEKGKKGKKEATADIEVFSTAELLGGDKWTYEVTAWGKGKVHVSLFRVGPRGKGLRPVAMVVSRQVTSYGFVSGSQRNGDVNILIGVGNAASFRYQFKESKHDFHPEFQKKKYTLGKGALFVIDLGEKPVKVKQIRADLGKLFKGKGQLTRKDLEAALKQVRMDNPAMDAVLKQIK
jgi:hypothetical protein